MYTYLNLNVCRTALFAAQFGLQLLTHMLTTFKWMARFEMNFIFLMKVDIDHQSKIASTLFQNIQTCGR